VRYSKIEKGPPFFWVLRKRRAYAEISGFINLLHGLIFRRVDKKRLLSKVACPWYLGGLTLCLSRHTLLLPSP